MTDGHFYSVFAGKNSQTGIAAKERYSDVTDEKIQSVKWNELIDLQRGRSNFKAVYPIWNSNQGYIKAVKLEETIFDYSTAKNIQIQDIWPKFISFYSATTGQAGSGEKPIISVVVAREQCYLWLKRIGKLRMEDFVWAESSEESVEVYLKSVESYHSVLCTAQQISHHKLFSDDIVVSNSINYTTFVTSAMKVDSQEDGNPYALLSATLPTSVGNISPALATLIDDLVCGAESLESIPIITFIINLGADADGVLIEAKKENVVTCQEIIESYREEYYESDGVKIEYIANVGSLKSSFIKEAFAAHERHIPKDEDFVKYEAPSKDLPVERRAAFYAIPAFKIFIHGYGVALVENVARRYLQSIYGRIAAGEFTGLNPDQEKAYQLIKGIVEGGGAFADIPFCAL